MAAVRYLVDDVDAALAFYVDRLGFAVHEDWGPVVVVTRDDLDVWLSGPQSSAAENALQDNRFILDVADLDATLAEFQLEPQIVESPAGRWTAIEDPAGNLIELFESS